VDGRTFGNNTENICLLCRRPENLPPIRSTVSKNELECCCVDDSLSTVMLQQTVTVVDRSGVGERSSQQSCRQHNDISGSGLVLTGITEARDSDRSSSRNQQSQTGDH